MQPDHREAEALEGIPGDPEALLFTSPRGAPVRYSNFRAKVWRPTLERASSREHRSRGALFIHELGSEIGLRTDRARLRPPDRAARDRDQAPAGGSSP